MSGLRHIKKWITVVPVLLWSSLSFAAVQGEAGIGFPRDVSVDGERIDWLLNVTNGFALLLFIIMCVWMAICIVSTIYEKQFFTKEHFGVFKELAQKTMEIEGKYDKQEITMVANINDPFYFKYYDSKNAKNFFHPSSYGASIYQPRTHFNVRNDF